MVSGTLFPFKRVGEKAQLTTARQQDTGSKFPWKEVRVPRGNLSGLPWGGVRPWRLFARRTEVAALGRGQYRTFAESKQFSWELKGLLCSQSPKRLETITFCNSDKTRIIQLEREREKCMGDGDGRALRSLAKGRNDGKTGSWDPGSCHWVF